MDENGGCWDDDITSDYMDVGQNGRLRGPQMEMSSLVLTIQLLGYLILTHTHIWIIPENSLRLA